VSRIASAAVPTCRCYHFPFVQVPPSASAAVSSPRSRLRALGAAAVLLFIITGFYWKLTLTRQYTWLEAPDYANQVLPWFQFQAGEWHRHHFPLWDPFEWGGQSLIGQMQPGAAYPFNWLLFILPLRNGWIRQVYLHWYFVLIHYTGALFCYLLCRDAGRSRGASLLAGAAFGITGWMGSTEWPQMLNGAVWTPLVFLFLLRMLRGRRPAISAALAGAFLGVAFLSGHHQAPIFIALAAAGVFLYAWFTHAVARRSLAAGAILFALFAFLLSALQTLPAYEYARLSVRWVGADEPVGWGMPVPYSVHTTFSFYPRTLVGMVLPGIAANTNAYIGFGLLALAVLAIAREWRDRAVRLLSAVALGGLLFALGAYDVLHGLLYAVVPIVGPARSPGMAIFLFHFGVAVLSAYAIDAFPAIPQVWTRRVIRALAVSGAAVLALMLALEMMQIPKALDYDRIAAAALCAWLFAAALYAWQRKQIAARTAIALLAALVLLQSGLSTGFAWPNREQPSAYLKKMSENIGVVEFLRRQPRFTRVEIDEQEIPYNFGDWHGIDVFGGYLASLTANTNRVQGDYRARMLFGVNLWIGRKPLRENQVEVFRAASGLRVYANPEAFPHAWVVHEAVAVPADSIADEFSRRSLADLRRSAFVTATAPALEKCAASEEGADRAEVTWRDTAAVGLEAELPCRGMVVLSDSFYPGWAATVDGKAVPIYEAYGVVRGVVAPAGRHAIEMRYRPPTVFLGAALTAVGCLGICLLVLAARPAEAPLDPTRISWPFDIYTWLEQLQPWQRVLDLGSGQGSFPWQGCVVVSLDADISAFPAGPEPSSGAARRVFGSGDRLPFRDRSFDLVVCHHAMEHMTGLQPTLAEMARVLHPDGRVYVSIPNGYGLCDAIYRYAFQGGEHVNRFTRQRIVNLIEEAVNVRLVRWQKLYSSFVYLRRLKDLAAARTPGLAPRPRALARFPRALVAAQWLLYLGTRAADRIFHRDWAIYGWAFYFDHSGQASVEEPAYVNVCLYCGSGQHAHAVRRPFPFTYRCKDCGRLNPYFQPAGNTS
jgi:SAM-dependent methyltransferase